MVDSLSVVGLIAIEAGGAVLTALAVVLAVRWLGAGWREARERHQARDVAALRAELFELRQAIDRLAAAQAASTADGSGGGSHAEHTSPVGVAPETSAGRSSRRPGGFTISI